MISFFKKLYMYCRGRLYFIVNIITLKLNNVQYGKNLKINGFLYVRNYGNITIGDNVIINSGSGHNPLNGGMCTKLVTQHNGNIFIGNGTGISNSSIISWDNIHIKNNVLIGAGSSIFDTDFHSMNYSERGTLDETIKTGSIYIGSDTFIGTQALILKNVTIGDRSIIGAGSVVRRGVFSSDSLLIGNPVEIINDKK